MVNDIRVVVDAVIVNEENKIVLVKRNKEPHKDQYVLPGGHLEKDELLKEAVTREVKEETGLDVVPFAMLGVFDEPNRDPRGRYISIAYLCRPTAPITKDSFKFDKEEIKAVSLESIDDIVRGKIKLGFDHEKMVKTYYSISKLGKTN